MQSEQDGETHFQAEMPVNFVAVIFAVPSDLKALGSNKHKYFQKTGQVLPLNFHPDLFPGIQS